MSPQPEPDLRALIVRQEIAALELEALRLREAVRAKADQAPRPAPSAAKKSVLVLGQDGMAAASLADGSRRVGIVEVIATKNGPSFLTEDGRRLVLREDALVEAAEDHAEAAIPGDLDRARADIAAFFGEERA